MLIHRLGLKSSRSLKFQDFMWTYKENKQLMQFLQIRWSRSFFTFLLKLEGQFSTSWIKTTPVPHNYSILCLIEHLGLSNRNRWRGLNPLSGHKRTVSHKENLGWVNLDSHNLSSTVLPSWKESSSSITIKSFSRYDFKVSCAPMWVTKLLLTKMDLKETGLERRRTRPTTTSSLGWSAGAKFPEPSCFGWWRCARRSVFQGHGRTKIFWTTLSAEKRNRTRTENFF